MSEVIESAAPVNAQEPVEQNTEQTQAPENPEDAKYADKFLKLMNQARAQQKLQAELKAERQRIEEMRKEIDEFNQRKARISEDPLEALKLLGTDYDKITQYLLQQGQPPDEIALMRKDIDEMKAEKQRLLEAQEEQRKSDLAKQEQQVYETFRQDVAKVIESGEYELIRANDGLETVIEYIQQDYVKQLNDKVEKPKVMSYEKACEDVELFYENNLEKFLALEKVQKRLNSEQPKESLFTGTVSKPRESNTTTLTNSMKAASQPITTTTRRPTDQELFDNAASLIKFT